MKLGIANGITEFDFDSVQKRLPHDSRFDLYMFNGASGARVRVPDNVSVSDAGRALRHAKNVCQAFVSVTRSWYFLVLEPCIPVRP